MGMAASQARLLSITARLNNIELQSQNISNAKLRLADSTDAASDKYVKALNKTHYLYNTYNASGDVVSTALTGAALTNYGELKNQYGLVNTAGQILVSERDAANFQNSNTLEEFLDKYGVLADISEGITIEYVNPAWTESTAAYEEDLEEWGKLKPSQSDPKYVYEYWSPTTMEEYEDLHDDWEAEEPNPEDFKSTEIVETGNNKLYNDFVATGGCLDYAIGGDSCYMHVLADAIGPGTHTTSSGQTYEVYNGSCGEHSESWCWNTAQHSRSTFDPITEALKVNYCSGDVIPGGTETATINGSQVAVGGPTSDPNMTLYQRAVDLLWEVHDEYVIGDSYGGPASSESLQKFFYFVEHDLKQLSEEEVEVFDQEGYDQAVKDWQDKEPEKPQLLKGFDQGAYDADIEAWQALEPEFYTTVDKYLPKTVRVATDLDEAQWYVNLWNRMNGVSNFKGGFGNNGAYDPDAGWASKSTTEQSWAVLKDGDMNSPEYLKYAIENGLITLEQVQFTEISSSEQGVKNAEWTSIVFTNAQDIIEVKDEVAISKAEVEYNKTLKELEIKDKQYDTDLKKLDTEHSALQTEYDSIKTVIDKNVQRSFKVFS